MNSNTFQWRSIKTRVTLVTIAIFMIGFLAMVSYASRILRGDMQRQLGEHQFSTVTLLAAHINDELSDRIKALEKIAETTIPAVLGDVTALQSRLEDRPILQLLFNDGIFVTRLDGTTVADVPLSASRIGVDFSARDYVVGALNDGKATIGKPVIGKVSRAPVISIAVPIHDNRGKVIGALVGATDLSKPNFLDKIAANNYGRTGGYHVVTRQEGVIVSATDKTRIMETLPAIGASQGKNRDVPGGGGAAIYVNPLGVEVLAMAKGVTVANWYVEVILPTEEAFAPIRAMQQRTLLTTITLVLVATISVWLLMSRLLKHEFAPMLDATRRLNSLADKDQPLAALPVTSRDEIGELTGGFNRLIETWTQRQDALNKSEQHYKLLLENIACGVVVHQADTSILRSNPMAVALLGLSEDQMRGKTAPDADWSFLNENGTSMLLKDYPVNRVITSGERFENLVLGVRHPGCKEPTWVTCNAFPMRGNDGNLLQVVVTFTDITERKVTQEKLLQLNAVLERRVEQRTAELARSNTELEQFAYVASHDLQEPLRMVVGFVQLLDKRLADKLDGDTREFMGFAVDGAKRMQSLIQDILAYSRVNTKGRTLEPVDSAGALKEALDLLGGRITETGAEVTAQPLPRVMADRTQLVQLFQNLIGNAIKFCGDHAPRVRVDASHAAGWWRFAVTDNGIGIAPEHRDQLFVVFKRLHTRREYAGTGIGLAICKRIIKHHGGEIGIESAAGGGSVFWFTLPEEKLS